MKVKSSIRIMAPIRPKEITDPRSEVGSSAFAVRKLKVTKPMIHTAIKTKKVSTRY